jgi:hypothetical protein
MAKKGVRQPPGKPSWNSGGGSPFRRKPRGKLEVGGKPVFSNTTREASKQQIDFPAS